MTKQEDYGQAYQNGYAKGYEDGKKASEPVVHAHWEDGYGVEPGTGRIINKSIDCSACEVVFKIESHDREYWKRKLKRCFCCGAVMDGGNEDG